MTLVLAVLCAFIYFGVFIFSLHHNCMNSKTHRKIHSIPKQPISQFLSLCLSFWKEKQKFHFLSLYPQLGLSLFLPLKIPEKWGGKGSNPITNKTQKELNNSNSMELVTSLGQGRGGVTPATPLKVVDFSMFLEVMAETTARPTKCMSLTLVGLLLFTKFHTLLVFFFFSLF